jgi:hypothetical protein
MLYYWIRHHDVPAGLFVPKICLAATHFALFINSQKYCSYKDCSNYKQCLPQKPVGEAVARGCFERRLTVAQPLPSI